MTRFTKWMSIALVASGVCASAALAQVGTASSVRTPADGQRYSAAARLANLPDATNRVTANAMRNRVAELRLSAVRERAVRVAALIEAGQCDAAVALAEAEADRPMAERIKTYCGDL